MKFRVLGDLQIDGTAVTASRDRVMLAVLLLGANRPVEVGTLVEAVWDTDPPATVRTQVQSAISRLRRGLPAGEIRTTPEGYRVDLGPDELDAVRWTGLLSSARDSADADDRRRLLRQALDLWRGPTLAGIESETVRRLAVAYDEQYAAAVEEWAELEITRGPAPAVITELHTAVARFPLRERLRELLMAALHGTGRQAEALAAYRAAHTVLRDEVGIEPGPGLQDLHRRILAGRSAPRQPAEAVAPVRTLPRAVRDFAGRTELIDDLLRDLGSGTPGPLIRSIDGMAGVGKTSLALHVAGLAGDRFPDAHLYLDLHGDSDRAAIDAGSALLSLLRQLGVSADRVPPDVDGRVALWRSELARRRTLLVLDNAATSAQVAPLLPGSGDNLTLITSRRRLAGLDAVPATSLPMLTAAEAADVFVAIVGARAAAEPAAVAEVVALCGALPLAVRLAAARMALRTDWRVADLVRRLHDRVLPQLTAGDRAVAAAFSTSYLALPEPHRRLFRLLGVHPGERIDAATAAALADVDATEAEDGLAALHEVHLLQAVAHGAYRMHDLIREYAASLAAEQPAEHRAAALRLFDHAVHRTAAVSWPVESPQTRLNRRFGEPLRPDLLPGPVTDPIRWFDQHHRDHMAVLRLAEAMGAHRHVWQLARAAWRLWYLQFRFSEVVDAHQRGLRAARSIPDEPAAAVMANYLASGLHRVGRAREAAAVLAEARKLPADQQRALGIDCVLEANLAYTRLVIGDVAQAAASAEAALRLARRPGQSATLAQALNAIGAARSAQGRLAESLRWHRHELFATSMSAMSLSTRLNALNNVAGIRMRLGHRPAERMLVLSISLSRRIGNIMGLVEASSALAVLHSRNGDLAAATALHREATTTARRYSDFRLQAVVHNDFGETLAAAGEPEAAGEQFRLAHALARRAEARDEEARSLEGLGRSATDDAARREHLRQALTIYRHIGVPAHVRRVEERLGPVTGAVAGR